MKRAGLSARDSPTKDRYAGKRQGQAGRGGSRRQKSGSRGWATLAIKTFTLWLISRRCVASTACLALDADL